MSSFAKASFDVAGYLASRPSYPPRIIDILLAYHLSPTPVFISPSSPSPAQAVPPPSTASHLVHNPVPAPAPAPATAPTGAGRLERAIDVGCGPGFLALSLAKHFDDVLALDPAEKMVRIGLQPGSDAAAQLPSEDGVQGESIEGERKDNAAGGKGCREIRYKVGTAERLGEAGVGDGEEGVDLVIAGQAAHWFDHAATWKELAKRVRSSGTVAYLGYGELIFPSHPHLSSLVSKHSQFFWSGGHWQAGRAIVEGLLDDVPFPVSSAALSSSEATGSREELLRGLPPLAEGLGHPVSDKVFRGWDLGDAEGGFDGVGEEWDAGSAVRLKWDTTTSAPGSALDSTLNGPSSSSSSTSSASQSPQADGITGNINTERHQWLMRKTFTRASLEGYFRTWSALHAYHEAHPEDAALRRNGKGRGTESEEEAEGDIVDRLMRDIWAGRAESAEQAESALGFAGAEEEEIEGAWPLVLMMIKKKA